MRTWSVPKQTAGTTPIVGVLFRMLPMAESKANPNAKSTPKDLPKLLDLLVKGSAVGQALAKDRLLPMVVSHLHRLAVQMGVSDVGDEPIGEVTPDMLTIFAAQLVAKPIPTTELEFWYRSAAILQHWFLQRCDQLAKTGQTRFAHWLDVHKAIDTLPKQQRKVWDLKHYGGFDKTQIAAMLGVRESMVVSTISQIKTTLNPLISKAIRDE
jgi:Sigma-70, region 4